MSFFFFFFFFFNDTATTEIYTLSLHDALPIFARGEEHGRRGPCERSGRSDRPCGGRPALPSLASPALPHRRTEAGRVGRCLPLGVFAFTLGGRTCSPAPRAP